MIEPDSIMNYLNYSATEIKELGKEKQSTYLNADPFPHITFDDFFDESILNKIADEFPDLSKQRNVSVFDGYNERKKLATRGEELLGEATKILVHYLNSQPFLGFLQELTGIEETLLPDPYYIGGGYHEIKPGGLLKIHADFNKHETTKLDRRINLLIYLNKDWDESYGGYLELWDKKMTKPGEKLLPVFNRVVIFSTTDFSYHGHPDPLTCPENRSRKSLALYYYSNGRPASEISGADHSTIYVNRGGVRNDTLKAKSALTILKGLVRDIVPPILFKTAKRIKK